EASRGGLIRGPIRWSLSCARFEFNNRWTRTKRSFEQKNDPAIGQRESKAKDSAIPLREQIGLGALDQAEVRRLLSSPDAGDSKIAKPMVSCVARFALTEPSSDWPEKAAATSG